MFSSSTIFNRANIFNRTAALKTAVPRSSQPTHSFKLAHSAVTAPLLFTMLAIISFTPATTHATSTPAALTTPATATHAKLTPAQDDTSNPQPASSHPQPASTQQFDTEPSSTTEPSRITDDGVPFVADFDIAAIRDNLCDLTDAIDFPDVDDFDYGANYIGCASVLGLTKGKADGTFGANDHLTRGQASAFFARLWRDTLERPCPEERHPFTDVSETYFASDDISCLYNLGIIQGSTATTFAPSQSLTTSQVTRLVSRLLNKAAPSTCDTTNDDLQSAATCLTEANVAPSTTESSLGTPATRAQMAVYIIGAWYHITENGNPYTPPVRSRNLKLAIGATHSCELLDDLAITCWHNSPYQDINTSYDATAVPDGEFTDVTVGGRHSCALHATNQTITCWGDNTTNQTNAPEGKYTAITSGWSHSCALHATNQTITCWGDNTTNQTNAPEGKYTAITSGGRHSCALRTSDRTITCWGWNRYGQTDSPAGTYRAIAVGGIHSCAVAPNRAVQCWGHDQYDLTKAPEGIYRNIVASYEHTCGFRLNEPQTPSDSTSTTSGAPAVEDTRTPADGSRAPAADTHVARYSEDNYSTVCWGSYYKRQNASPSDDFIHVTSNLEHSCGLRSDRSVACWGDNTSGQIDTPEGEYTAITSGLLHTCAISAADMSIACWGSGQDKQTEAPAGEYVMIDSGNLHTCGLKSDGSITCWGNNRYGQTNAPPKINVPQDDAPQDTTGTGGTADRDTTDTDGTTSTTTSVASTSTPSGYLAITAGGTHTCALRADKTVTCWGNNQYGQTNAPNGIYTAVDAGILHTCAVRTDKTVTCWGDNQYGQTNAPNGTYTAVTSGYSHTCGLRAVSRNIKCWGDNTIWQTDAPSGQHTAISASVYHTCAVGTDKKISCWGVRPERRKPSEDILQ